jgi:hypothetical protein
LSRNEIQLKAKLKIFFEILVVGVLGNTLYSRLVCPVLVEKAPLLACHNLSKYKGTFFCHMT